MQAIQDTNKYKLLPDPTVEEYAALKESIRVFGVKEAVVVDENGEVLEGRQRLKICAELKITDYPVRIEAGLTEEQKRHLVLSLNVNRRALTTAQKREIVKRELQRTPDISNRWLAEICGVDHKTVADVRKELEAGGEVPHLTALRGKDGKTQRATKVRNTAVLVPSSRMTNRALSAARSLGDEAPRRTLALNRAERLAAIKNHRDKEKRPLLTALPKEEADQYRLIHRGTVRWCLHRGGGVQGAGQPAIRRLRHRGEVGEGRHRPARQDVRAGHGRGLG